LNGWREPAQNICSWSDGGEHDGDFLGTELRGDFVGEVVN